MPDPHPLTNLNGLTLTAALKALGYDVVQRGLGHLSFSRHGSWGNWNGKAVTTAGHFDREALAREYAAQAAKREAKRKDA